MAACPKCSGELVREWTNKRQQRMGMCGGCGKMVYLGKAEGGKKPVEKPVEEKTERKAAPAKAAGKRTPPAARTRSRNPERGPGEPKPKRSGTFFDRVNSFLDRQL